MPAQTPPTPAYPARVRNHFDFDEPLRTPGFFDFAVLGAPGQASWKVLVGNNPPSTPNVVTQVIANRPVDSIAVAIRRNVLYQDGSWSVALQKGSGRGGIVFRLAGEKDFRALLVDLKTGEARLTAFQDGHPVELAQGRAPLDRLWGVLSITAHGTAIGAQWEGKPLLDARDPRPTAGRAGIATAGEGMTSFDEFILDPSEK